MNERERREAEERNRVVIRDKRRFDPVTGEPRESVDESWLDTSEGADALSDDQKSDEPEPGALFEARRKPVPSPGAAALQRKLAERTSDLQRVTAEYANYRKRMDRDKDTARDVTTGAVLAALLPILDNLDRAREHGDLTGAFKAVADQFADVLERLGLTSFADVGDEFDPMVHEAVAHQTSAEVSVPTCVSVMRRGYKFSERLLRPALVGVADPENPEPVTPDTGSEPAAVSAEGAPDTERNTDGA